MAHAIVAPMPQALDLAGEYTFVFDAQDPSTGASVAGVTVSDAQLFGEAIGQATGDVYNSGPFMLVPGPGA